jgi:hypothetical protein
MGNFRSQKERREIRKVQKDGYLPACGSFYPAPAHLIGQLDSISPTSGGSHDKDDRPF